MENSRNHFVSAQSYLFTNIKKYMNVLSLQNNIFKIRIKEIIFYPIFVRSF